MVSLVAPLEQLEEFLTTWPGAVWWHLQKYTKQCKSFHVPVLLQESFLEKRSFNGLEMMLVKKKKKKEYLYSLTFLQVSCPDRR